MKKQVLFLTLASALSLAGAAMADKMDASVFGGYTQVSGGDINANVDAIGGFLNGSVNHISGGYYVGIDGTYQILPMLKVGPRIELVDASTSASGSGVNFTGETRVIPVMLGASTDMHLMAGLSLDGSLYAGYGFTSSHLGFDKGVGTLDANGDCFVGEATVGAKYKIIPLISVGLDLGYRYTTANTQVVNGATGIFNGGGSPVGHNLTNFNTSQDAKVDYSGLNLGGAVTFSF